MKGRPRQQATEPLWVSGINPVKEALRGGDLVIHEMIVARGDQRVQELQESLSDSYAANAGLTFRPRMGYTIDVEAQYLRNAVSSSDVRLFFRVSKRFDVRRSPAGARP